MLLFPTLGCGVEEALKHDVPATMATLSAFNQWLEDDWGFSYHDRLIAAPMLSLADPVVALDEVDSLIERGARIVHIRPAPVPAADGRSRSLGDEVHDPVWARLAEASVPVAFHLGDSGYNRFAAAWGGSDTFGFGNSDPLAQVLVSDRPIHDSIATLVVHGVFKRHPTLRVASIENGSDWLALLVKRLRKQANQTPWVFAEDPLETIRRHVWVTPYYEEDFRKLADLVGVERILFGSDWPHGEGLAEPMDFVKELAGFSEHRSPKDHARQLPRADRTHPLSNATESSTSDTRQALKDEVERWLDEHWDPELPVDDWWRLVAKAGWTAPHFPPEQGGRGLPLRAQATVRAAFADHGALRPPGGLGLLLAAPTILTHGTPDQIARLVPPILEGQIGWCQLFSEPDAGSDLAGLKTRAVRDGDHWTITGQKVWSSDAMGADYGMLLARTDFGVPKHAGISWFAFPLDQPGVEIRPLREMTGEALFNEVFIDGAICADANLIGGEGNGWAVTQTTLHFERTGIGAGGAHAGFPGPGPERRHARPDRRRRRTRRGAGRREDGRRTGAHRPRTNNRAAFRATLAAEARRARDLGGGRALERPARQGGGGAGRRPGRGQHRKTAADEDHEAVVGDRRRHPRRARPPCGSRRTGWRRLRGRLRLRAGVVHIRRHRSDPAQHRGRTLTRPPARTGSPQGRAVRRSAPHHIDRTHVNEGRP